MKKRFLALFTVMLLAFVMIAAVSAADPTLELATPGTGVEYSALSEGQTFDVYVLVPMTKQGTGTNYIYRVTEDTVTAAPSKANGKLTNFALTVTWDKNSLALADAQTLDEVSTTPVAAGDGYNYAYLVKTTYATVQDATQTKNDAAGSLVVSYGSDATNGFAVRGPSTAPEKGVIVKLTFRVIAGAVGGDNLPITLNRTYTYNGTNVTATPASSSTVNVSVLAGCKHENKTPLDAAGLVAAGKENVTATCCVQGETWYLCSDCSNYTSVITNKLAHAFTDERVIKEPTCIGKGEKALFCVLDINCTEHGTVTDIDPLGHDFTSDNHVYVAPTCDEDGYEVYWCPKCYHVSATENGSVVAGQVYYVNGAFYAKADGTGSEIAVPNDVKLEALGHDWVVDRVEGGNTYYVCTRAEKCGVPEMMIDAADTVRYVSDNGTGDGLTADTPTTLDKAYDAFKGIPADVECTIYLIGKVTLPNRQVSSQNTVAKSFEETQHDAHITVTTAPGTAKATLEFPFATTSMIFLYGPTTFDNIKVSSTHPGTSSGSSSSINIFARGFELTLTENFETVSSGSGITYSKEKGSFSLAVDPMTMNIPDCKLYLLGGFYANGGYDGANMTTFETTMNIYGGTYWVVSGASRNENASIKDCVININIGGNAKIGQLIPISTATGSNSSGTVVNMHYLSSFESVLIYRAQNASTTGEYTVNHFFHKGTGNMRVGDFMMGAAENHGRNVNVYCYELDAGAKAMAESVYDKGVLNSSYDIYNGVGSQEYMSFTEWCIAYGGGHDYEGDVCTFCGIEKCNNHVVENLVVSVPSCQTPGVSYDYCTVCYEHIGEDTIIPADPDAHNFEWNITVSPIVSRCVNEGCTCVRGTYDGETPAVFYVSDNGYGDGGFTADYPLNNFETAFKLAASLDTDAYIYVVGSITLYPNYNGTTTHTVFVEPAHDNKVTVGGYINSGVIKFSAVKGGRILYNLNGTTQFENVEFNEYSAINPSYSFIYLIGNHNHLIVGENVTCSYERHASGSNYHNGKLVVLGGCYHANHTMPSSDAKNCRKTDAHVTLYSGNYYNFIGGSAGIKCGFENGTIILDFFGDIVIQDYFAAGSYQLPAGDIVMNLKDGNVASGSMFSFYGYNGANDKLHSADVKNVTIKVFSGTVSSNNFQASQVASALRPLGASISPDDADNNKYDVTAHMDSLTICYDPANGSARDTYNHILACVLGGSKAVSVKTIGDTYCEDSANGEHAMGNLVEEVGSTCAKQGYSIYVCAKCDEEYTVPGDIVEHTFGDKEVASAANCINPEILKETCGVCGFIVYSIGDAAATGVHDFGEDSDVCIYCTQSRQDLCEHVWDAGTEVTTGCGTGYTYTCTKQCGATKTEITSSDHNFGKYTVTVQPTETEPGVKTRKCKSCGMVETALIYADGGAMNSEAIAVDANGSLADVDIALSKLTKAEREVVNALLQDTAYGSEVKVSYDVDGNVTGVTYSIPLPAEYADMQNVQVIVKDDEGKLHVVEFTVEKGYIVFTF